MEKGYIRVDYNNMMDFRIGLCNGIRRGEIEELVPYGKDVVRSVEEKGWGFRALTHQDETIRKVKEIAEFCRRYENFVVIGIGGSALGNRALHNALTPKYYNLHPSLRNGGPRVFFLENVDPESLTALLQVIDLGKTVFNVITKSGGTTETMVNFIIIRDMLIRKVGKERYREHIIATTDPERGFLRELVSREGYLSLDIPPDVGGRFSVFSPVGLLSAGVAGIPIEEFICGIQQMDKACTERDVWKNPAMLGAILQYISYTRKNRHIFVLMNYSDHLKDLGEWFRQLWAESLGKRFTKTAEVANIGPTPVQALGTIDQHSQIQLYMEGPQDKTIMFVRTKSFKNDISIPEEVKELGPLEYLYGRTLTDVILAEQKATEIALTRNERPNCTVEFSAITPYTLAGFMYMMEMMTAYIGELFRIDVFNQPGVEEGKKLTKQILKNGDLKEAIGELTRDIPQTKEEYILTILQE